MLSIAERNIDIYIWYILLHTDSPFTYVYKLKCQNKT